MYKNFNLFFFYFIFSLKKSVSQKLTKKKAENYCWAGCVGGAKRETNLTPPCKILRMGPGALGLLATASVAILSS